LLPFIVEGGGRKGTSQRERGSAVLYLKAHAIRRIHKRKEKLRGNLADGTEKKEETGDPERKERAGQVAEIRRSNLGAGVTKRNRRRPQSLIWGGMEEAPCTKKNPTPRKESRIRHNDVNQEEKRRKKGGLTFQ